MDNSDRSRRYFTSDLHLNETRIGAFNPFFRPFKSVEEQNDTIIRNINEIVRPQDTLYMVGDIVMDLEGVALLNDIRCKNRVLVLGNYDTDKIDALRGHFQSMSDDLELTIGGVDCYLNHYPVKRRPDRFNIVGHIHGLWKVKPNTINVSTDAWHCRPVSEEEILFVHTTMKKGNYDENVFLGCK